MDTDDDGLPDEWEIAMFGSLSQGPDGDYDNDQLTNFQEYQLETDPTAADSDGDGTSDYYENLMGWNPADDSDPPPGIYYNYDSLGRIKTVFKIPVQ